MGCGQIDVCVLTKNKNLKKILVIECKHGKPQVSKKQRMRLDRTCELLGLLFNEEVELLVK